MICRTNIGTASATRVRSPSRLRALKSSGKLEKSELKAFVSCGSPHEPHDRLTASSPSSIKEVSSSSSDLTASPPYSRFSSYIAQILI